MSEEERGQVINNPLSGVPKNAFIGEEQHPAGEKTKGGI